ncbi:wax ester/triacylglycerol synthase family O-acyltransferase [Ideonella sp.]|uniref:WS/DGAT/MGAT family O-acyltransferase n=1 Tax=Ideonella sp. TaxID=1929293 RepID=UPI002B47FA95|nr:wax ester/triacylglycerol synthase family O-acyltransferase [Ideonella sp.]HJV69617.1 wax ester/triacylglycerol synthase family O-acyltransferase [Ideonella sp.]
MDHLSGMDASFLHLETPEMPMHVGSLLVLDLPEGYTGDFYEDVKRHVATRLHLAKVFQRKLALMPFELANPVWVDDEDLDLDHHIRHIIVPRPGTREQLERLVGRLHSPLLDRSRPLWEMVVIEGLATGQVAVYTKVHHAAIDGQAGVALAAALLDLSDTPRVVKPPRPRRRLNRYQLGVAELASAALGNTVSQYVKLVRTLPTTLRAVRSVLLPVDEQTGKRRLALPKGWQFAPRTPINVAITNQRSFATRALPLAELKRMAKASDTSLNDVVLAICAGALRRYLAEYDCKPDKPLVAGVPVSLREQGNQDMTNQVSFILVGLATDVKDPLERLKAIHASAVTGKKVTGQVKGAIPMDFPSFGAPWLMSGLASLYGRSRLADRMPPVANVVISNVPGPQTPFYLAGAKIATYSPVSIPAHGMALNVTVQSYNGVVEFGLTACRRALPDVGDLGDYMVDAAHELARCLAAQAEATAAPLPAPMPKQPAPKKTAPAAIPVAAKLPRRRRAAAAAA